MIGIGEAAALLGVAVVTMRRWDREGRLAPAARTLGGHRRYDRAVLLGKTEPESPRVTVAYARVSCHAQKDDLIRQAERLRNICVQRGWADAEIITDLGSGLNFAKRGLIRLVKLIRARRIERLVVAHEDRLLRFGAELLFRICAEFGIEVVVLEEGSKELRLLRLSTLHRSVSSSFG